LKRFFVQLVFIVSWYSIPRPSNFVKTLFSGSLYRIYYSFPEDWYLTVLNSVRYMRSSVTEMVFC
jgi:hypothetical protein